MPVPTRHSAPPTNIEDLRRRKTINRFTVLGFSKRGGTPGHPRYFWRCRCSCGTVKDVDHGALVSGGTKSCGCLRKERATKHGGYKTPEYGIWACMVNRCRNPNYGQYKDYGGRGISVHQEWVTSFSAFLADVGPRPSPLHTLDRFPNKNGNYEPGNVRWATRKEQQRNTRSNRMLTFNGETLCVTEWAERLGIKPDVIRKRLRTGWTVEEIIRTPVKPTGQLGKSYSHSRRS